MRLLVEAGQPAAALHHYRQCEEVLGRELGVEPEAETRLLYEGIRKQYNVSEGAPEPAAPELVPARGAPAPVGARNGRKDRTAVAELQMTLSRQIVKLSRQYVHAVGTFLQQRQIRSELISARQATLQVRRAPDDHLPPRQE